MASFIRRLIFAAALLTVIPLWPASISLKTFTSQSEGYIVEYPDTWYRNPSRLSDTLDVQNFPPSKAVHGLHIPGGGAEIEIASWRTARNGRSTVEEWIKGDTAHQKVLAKREINVSLFSGVTRAIEVREEADVSPGPLEEAVIWYFALQDKWFEAQLVYWRGDPNAEKYLQTMRQIVSSLRLTPSREQPKRPERAR